MLASEDHGGHGGVDEDHADEALAYDEASFVRAVVEGVAPSIKSPTGLSSLQPSKLQHSDAAQRADAIACPGAKCLRGYKQGSPIPEDQKALA